MENHQRSRVAAVLIDQGKIAVIKRVFPECIHYAFPGGKIEEGETHSDALKQEMTVNSTRYECAG